MGFFSVIASEVRRGMTAPPPAVPTPIPPVAAPVAPVVQPVPTIPDPAEISTPAPTEPAPSAHIPPPPEIKLTVDDTAHAPDDTAARQAHEAAEAKRKAEFDAKQAEKKAKRQAVLDKIKAMDDAELLDAATGRVAADTEKLTRRNMKEAVCAFVQDQCKRNLNIARLCLAPEKSMINCFKYINRKAQEYAEQEMKDNGIERRDVYGLDVPDDLVYQWAMDYFDDPNAKEDHNDDEKFVPKPYVPPARKKTQGKAAKKSEKKKSAAEQPTKAPEHTMEQISLM